MASSGFAYYWNLLGLNAISHSVHYDFGQSGNHVPSTQNAQPQFSGILEGVGSNFWQAVGSGHFGTGLVSISNATGLPSDFWTHFFIYEREATEEGILFSSLHGLSGTYSGYMIGVTDNNRLYFESYGQLGPNLAVSQEIYGKKNAIAVVKARDILSFHNYNFDTKELISESFTIPPYIEQYSSASIGGASNVPAYTQNHPFQGYIDDYVYVKEALTPTNLKILFSGFYSAYLESPPPVTYSGFFGITGYRDEFYGITGVTGYSYQESLSGTDVFGDPVYVVIATPLTGYLLSGLEQVALTGWVVLPITGASIGSFIVDEDFGKNGFGLTEISYLRQIDANNLSFLNIFGSNSLLNLNKVADFDTIKYAYELDAEYAEEQIQLYRNGVYQQYGGYQITGNAFASGFKLDESYFLEGFTVNATGAFTQSDTIIYDVISGNRSIVAESAYGSGTILAIDLNATKKVFLNGLLQTSGVDYEKRGSDFTWLHEAEGQVVTVEVNEIHYSQTGIHFGPLPMFQRGTSQLFLNGQRMLLDEDYVENSAFDLLGPSGLFEKGLEIIYNNPGTFLE